MGSLGNPNPWAPYDTYKDCSQGICSIYCPQWCYIIFPPPPHITLEDDKSAADFSPLIIAVIGILASAFILVSYYTIISKFCRRRQGHENINSIEEFNENRDAIQSSNSTGLDEVVIKSITVCKYKKGDGLVDGTDCSVCLSEFQEEENLRLLPKCNHAFHVPCIDTWLKSHSSCPLCRANITHQAAPTASSIQETTPGGSNVSASAFEYQQRNDSVLVIQDLEIGVREEVVLSLTASDDVPKTSNQDLGDTDMENVERRESRVEIGQDGIQPFRRSVSLNFSLCQGRVSIADILSAGEDANDDDGFQLENLGISKGTGSSKQSGEEFCKRNIRNEVFNLVRSPLAMKDQFQQGDSCSQDLKRGSTGLGWDPTKKTIAAEDWWQRKLEVFPNAKRFKTNGIDPCLEDKYEKMYYGIVVELDDAWTPSSGVLLLNNDQPIVHEVLDEGSGDSDENISEDINPRAPAIQPNDQDKN